MDDIDRDIERSHTGKRRENAHEIIKHSKIPATNLPPLPHKGPILVPLKFETPSKKNECEFSANVHSGGGICGKPIDKYCRLCNKPFCSVHLQPEDHNCPMVFY